MQTAINLFIHALFLGLALLSLQWLPVIPKPYLPVLDILPYGIAVVSTLLGLRFNRSRVIFSTLLMLAAYGSLHLWMPMLGTESHRLLVNGIAIVLPLNIVFISYYSERGIFTPVGLARFLLILLQIVGVAWLLHNPQSPVSGFFDQPLFPGLEIRHEILGNPAVLAILSSAVALITLYLIQPDPFRSALFGAMILSLYGTGLPPDDTASIAIIFSFALTFPLLTLVHESYRMAFVDELTGLRGRRALNETMDKLGGQYVIAMLDVDHFKKFNDTYGHDAGDDVLQLLGSKLKGAGGGGKPFRYGGEEFAMVFSGISAADAKPHLEALREAVASKKFTLRKQERRNTRKTKKRRRNTKPREVKVTISIGYAERNDRSKTPATVLKAADKALYRAKRGGRNRISR